MTRPRLRGAGPFSFPGCTDSGLRPNREPDQRDRVRRKTGLRNRRRPILAAAFQRRHECCENIVVASGPALGLTFIFYSSFAGFAIPFLASPRIGLSVHTLSALQGVFLVAVGLLWPKLRLGIAASWAAFWLFIYGAASILAAYTVAAIWGGGNETIMLAGELPHGLSHGTTFQETLIKVLAYSSAPTGGQKKRGFVARSVSKLSGMS